ncbi:uncharacterized protein LOC128964627 [Oppia nitens]|uniref:uncharacterized protein LOC128964627 n=1 Tax=Oppia nitens TaxID=1686743 RepID=UPI0023DC2D53|nr:uncharacterized protein LOC128964627 [Oppia nitens]
MTMVSTMLLMAKCLGSPLNNTIKVSIPRLKFDTFFNMYFRENEQLLVDDNKLKCKPGDWLIIRQLDQPLSLRVNHRAEKVVYRAGHLVDPLTGKQSLGYEYVSDADRQSHIFGLKPPKDRI